MKNSKSAQRTSSHQQPKSIKKSLGIKVATKTTVRKNDRSSTRLATSRDMVLALVMALGLSAVFLSPFRFSSPPNTELTPTPKGGQVLGASISVPLQVLVVVRSMGQEWRTTTYPRTGMVAEALGQAAGMAGTSFEYQSRGSSIYLQRLFGQADDATGWWNISINGLTVTDLSLTSLEQGDEVFAEWRLR